MNNLFRLGNDGTPITLLFKQDYENWLRKQSSVTQTWLNALNFDAKGAQAIPSSDGSIEQVIYIIEQEPDFFIAGDLSTSLPEGNYRLNLESLTINNSEINALKQEFYVSWGLAAYNYDRYKKNEKKLATLSIDTEAQIIQASKTIKAIYLVRDMINCPASDLMPQDISDIVEQLATEYNGITTKHIIGEQLLKENFPTIHAVGRASIHQPRLIDFTWGDEKHPKITLVGKGVCFDSGGLDLKPASAMRNMKKDMGGAAHVLGLASLIIQHNLPVRLRVLIPAVENAVSSNAFRPGDVLTTRQGITVEIDNTDAEGRLVLCDALTEADSEKPALIIDFATLTGACRVALGTELPGFFCNNNQVATKLTESSIASKDPIWQLPLFKPYQSLLNSQIADTQNSVDSPFGGAITAALYLQKFVSDETPWVHFDVMAWNTRKLPGRPVGGEAFGIRAVFNYLESTYSI